MQNFTPYSALLGGALIGLATVILMAVLGRIAGISGILAGAMTGPSADRAWRTAFLADLVIAPLAVRKLFEDGIPFVITDNLLLVTAAGLLVGFGTRLGSGCTSGHGVCGLSRLSARSFVAVLCFMLSGMMTVALAKLAIGSVS